MPIGTLTGNFVSRVFGVRGGLYPLSHPPSPAIDYYKDRLKKQPSAPLVRMDENRQPAYDKLAVLGCKQLNEREIVNLQYEYRKNRNTRNSLPSGGNFFQKLGGNRGRILEAERRLDEQANEIQNVISKLKKNLADLEHLPRLPSFMYNAKAPRVRDAHVGRHSILIQRKSKATQVM